MTSKLWDKGTGEGHESVLHFHGERLESWLRTGWLVLLLAALGVVAFVTAVLVAWPAISYLAAKLF